jgi:hypothetical protein
MRKLILLVLVPVFPLFVSAQQIFTGYLRDAVTSRPVEGANIQCNQRPATSSGPMGQFTVNESLPVLLTITHVAFYTKEIIISKLPDDSLLIDLVPRTRDLEEVVVTGKPYLQFFKPETFYIRDYAIQDNRVWALGCMGKNILRPELRLLNLSGKTLGKMPVGVQSEIFQDPSGTVHLYNRDSMFQLYADKRQIVLLYPNPINPATSLLFNFQIIRGDTVIYTDFNDYRTYCEFIAADLASGTRDTVFVSYNRLVYQSPGPAKNYQPGPIPGSAIVGSPPGRSTKGLPSALRNDPDHPEYAGKSDKDIMVAESMQMPRKTQKDTGSEMTRNSRIAFANALYKRNILNKPIRVSAHYASNRYYIFETANLLLWILDNHFAPLGSVPADPGSDAREVQLVQDPVNENLYLTYQIHGTCFISRVDPATGLMQSARRLTGFPFAEKISVYAGKAYFIYQSPVGQNYTNLYSVNLQ